MKKRSEYRSYYHFAPVALGYFLLLLNFSVCAQNPCTGNIVFRRQSQVDSFQVLNPGCSVINGFITITGNDITNIDSLYSIKEINGDLAIRYTGKLKSLSGLSNLEIVALGFMVIFNDSLLAIDQFNELRSASYIDIQDNNQITAIKGFNKVESTGKINLQDHKKLEAINAFHGLNRASDIIITNNKILKSITGFNSGIEYGALRIDKNPVLEKLIGFDKVKKIKSIRIGDNLVKEIDGFYKLDSIWNSWLQIEDENYLERIIGFDSLKYSKGLHFSNIYALKELPRFENLIRIGGPLYIGQGNLLNSISAFKNVKIVEGQLRLSNNIELTTVDAFQNLDSCYNSVIIEGANKLKNINGFQKLKYIDESLTIFSAYLEEINGFQSLVEIAGLKNQEVDTTQWINFQFQAHKLKSVKDFSNLRKVRGMWVNRNHELTDLSGFDNIDTSYLRYIVLKDNEKLEQCNSKFLCSYLENPKHKASIFSNAPGCSSREEILASCTTGTDEAYTSSTTTHVFPNPCPLNSSLWFTGEETDFHLTLHNSTGQKAFEGWVRNPVHLQINKPGLYYYLISDKSVQRRGMVVLE